MDIEYLREIGILENAELLVTSGSASVAGPIRDAECQTPVLFASRDARKGKKAAKVLLGSRDQYIDWIFIETRAAWVDEITSAEFEERLGAVAAIASQEEWVASCMRNLTSFSRGVATVNGFQDALSQHDLARISQLVAQYLDAKIVKQAHPCWKEAVSRGGVVPLWQNNTSIARAATFDCILLEPFNPAYDPTFLLNTVGMHRIGTAIQRLAVWLRQANGNRIIALLAELERLTSKQQLILRDLQSRVLSSVHSALAPVLALFQVNLRTDELLPFGSLEIGMATAASDIDICIRVAANSSIYSLVHSCKEALEKHPPSWLVASSLTEVLQTSKVPILTFEYRLGDSCNMPGASQLQDLLQELELVVQVPQALDRIQVDICFNNSLAHVETRFQRDTIGLSGAAYQLLLWLKYWTKSEGIDDSKHGMLSSFGWRLIAMAYLVEVGAVSCLRDGFDLVLDPPRAGGMNVWCRTACKPPSAEVDSFTLLEGLCSELLSCVGSETIRVFQVVTSRIQELDEIIGHMAVPCGAVPEAMDIALGKQGTVAHQSEDVKRVVLLTLPHGSRKWDILEYVASRLVGTTIVDWDGAHDTWDSFGGRLLSALEMPSVRIVLTKMVPDHGKVKQLALFLGQQGSILCLHPSLHVFDGQAGDLLLMSQFRRLLLSNGTRSAIGGSSVYVSLPEEFELRPPSDNKAYRRWAEEVWAGEKGLHRAFLDLKGKSQRCRHLIDKAETLQRVSLLEVPFFNAAPTLVKAEVDELTKVRRLPDVQRAADRNRADVVAFMQHLLAGTGVFAIGASLYRSPLDVASDICELLGSL